MRRLFILLLTLPTLLFAQDELTFFRYSTLKFQLHYPANQAEEDYDEIDFSREQPATIYPCRKNSAKVPHHDG